MKDLNKTSDRKMNIQVIFQICPSINALIFVFKTKMPVNMKNS